MANVITKHKDLSEQYVEPEIRRFKQAATNLYLYGMEKRDLTKHIRLAIKEIEKAGIPVASPRKRRR
jgi:hypothetical protein